jgi:ribosomal protein S10
MTLILNINSKIYIYVKSFYYNYLIRDLKKLFIFFKKYNFFFLSRKLIFLPKKIKKFSVVKSPFVSKLDKEQFEIRVYKLLIIFDLSNDFFINFFRQKRLTKIDNLYYKVDYFYSH